MPDDFFFLYFPAGNSVCWCLRRLICVNIYIGVVVLYLAVRQLRFSLYSGAVITKALAVVVFLLLFLVSDSVEYPMPYASHAVLSGDVPAAQLVLRYSP